jgi:DNA-binding NarL/FixJ family response regulator
MDTIWIIEDHRRLRETVAEAVRLAGDHTVVPLASCEKALAALDADAPKPEVILLDLGLPGMSGLEGLRRFKQRIPEAEVVVFTVFDDRERVFEAICNGASGYLLKSEPLERIVAAVEEARRGGSPMSPEIARCVLDRFSRLRSMPSIHDAPPIAESLSEREREVLRLLAEGLVKKEVANRMEISLHTVDNYVRRIYAKLHVNTLGGAVARAIRDGIV